MSEQATAKPAETPAPVTETPVVTTTPDPAPATTTDGGTPPETKVTKVTNNPAVNKILAEREAKANTPATPEQLAEMNSERFAQLTKREKVNLQKAQDLKQQETDFESKYAPVKNFEDLRSSVQKDPAKMLETFGITYDQLTKSMMDKKPLETEPEAFDPEKFKAQFKEEQDAERQKEKDNDAATETRDKAMTQTYTDIGSALESKEGENLKFPLSASTPDGKDAIFQIMVQTYEESAKKGDPIILTPTEAADAMEKNIESEVERMVKLPRVQQMLEKLGFVAKPGSFDNNNKIESKDLNSNPGNQSITPTTTLTNDNSQQAILSNPRPLTRDEKIAKAAAKLRYN